MLHHHAELGRKATTATLLYAGADEDILSIDTFAAPIAEHIQGPITRALAKQLNYQVLLFLRTLSHMHENMMLPKSICLLLLGMMDLAWMRGTSIGA
jgi:hypothetical protein